MRVGRGNSLLIPCSQDTICIFWAEFGNFCVEFEKFTVNFAVLAIKNAIQVEIGLFHSTMSAEGHAHRGSALAARRRLKPLIQRAAGRHWAERTSFEFKAQTGTPALGCVFR